MFGAAPTTARKVVLTAVATAVLVPGLPAFHARAGDYEIAYAIDARGEKTMARSQCNYKVPCLLTLALTTIDLVFEGTLAHPSLPGREQPMSSTAD